MIVNAYRRRFARLVGFNSLFFFFQAEDGIRDLTVTGVQTCALPISTAAMQAMRDALPPGVHWSAFGVGRMQMPMVAQAVLLGGNVRVGLEDNLYQIGRASCRERV